MNSRCPSNGLRRYAVLFVVCIALTLTAVAATAASLSGEVVGVTDGDTVSLLDVDRTQYKIRLTGIDAPEKRQAFGQRSKQSLATLVFHRHVTVEWMHHDRYGRILGKILLAGRDVNLAQVAAGMAWHYKAYEREQSVGDRLLYAHAEDAARGSGVGLWRQADPLAPWDFRHPHR